MVAALDGDAEEGVAIFLLFGMVEPAGSCSGKGAAWLLVVFLLYVHHLEEGVLFSSSWECVLWCLVLVLWLSRPCDALRVGCG